MVFNHLRAEHNLKPIDEHLLAHQCKKNESAHKKLCHNYNNSHHGQDKNWHHVAKGHDHEHDHTSIDRLLERIEKMTENIKEAITHEKNHKKEETHTADHAVNHERHYTPSPRSP